MNLLTVLGAAITCGAFCDLLAKDPVEAARLLGVTLTYADIEVLKEIFSKESADKLCDELSRIRPFFCKKSPCPAAPVISELIAACAGATKTAA